MFDDPSESVSTQIFTCTDLMPGFKFGITLWRDTFGGSFQVERGYRKISEGRIVPAYACLDCRPWEDEFSVPECMHIFAERIRRGEVVMLDSAQAKEIQLNRPTTAASHRSEI
jgi:hypothetical protein